MNKRDVSVGKRLKTLEGYELAILKKKFHIVCKCRRLAVADLVDVVCGLQRMSTSVAM